MQLRFAFLTGILAGALPLASFARTGAPAGFKPRFLVGLGVATGTYQLPNAFGNTTSLMPTVGVQFRPRWAVQVSATYHWKDYSYDYSDQLYINGRFQYGHLTGTSQQRLAAIPILIRYTLSHRPERRLQADLLAGATVVYSAYRGSSATADSSRTVVEYYKSDTAVTGIYFALGPSLRYRLGQNLDLTGDFVFNFRLNSYQDYKSASRSSATAALGLRYRFGRG